MARPMTRTPRWVKAFGIVAVVLALVFAGLHLTGYGFGGHTPLRDGSHRPRP